MKRNRAFVLGIGLVLAVLGGTAPGLDAATVTTTLPVTVSIVGGCTVGATGVNFGNYTPGPSTPALSGTGTITVTCPSTVPYKLGLNAGNGNLNGVVGQFFRAMTIPNVALISYELYKDASRTSIWGDSDLANTYPLGSSVAGTGSGAVQSLTVFGLVPGGQTAPSGTTANDLLTVTLLF